MATDEQRQRCQEAYLAGYARALADIGDITQYEFCAITTPKANRSHAFDAVETSGDLVFVSGKPYIHPRSSLIRINGEMGVGPFVLHEVQPDTVRLRHVTHR